MKRFSILVAGILSVCLFFFSKESEVINTAKPSLPKHKKSRLEDIKEPQIPKQQRYLYKTLLLPYIIQPAQILSGKTLYQPGGHARLRRASKWK